MKRSGFTLIELLVAIAITLIMFTLGLVNYFNFRDQQKIKQAQSTVKEAVIDAQNAARSGRVKECDQLQSYQIRLRNSSGQAEIEVGPLCQDDLFVGVITYAMPDGISFNSEQTLHAQPINGLIDDDPNYATQAGPFTITINLESGTSVDLCIDKSGTISEGPCP